MALTLGLPRMHKEAGERRDFLPDLVRFVTRLGAKEIVVEEGYGSGMGLTADQYAEASPVCRVGTYEECFAQDIVLVLRYPSDDAIQKMKRGAVLLSMVHYPTRPGRVAQLQQLGLRAVSLDSIADDSGRRLVENLESVGWNGVGCGFKALKKTWPALMDQGRRPVRVLVIGAGAVGAHAMRAAAAYGDRELRGQLLRRGFKGVEVMVIDYDLTQDEAYVRGQLAQADMVVDATLRPDASKAVLPNAWLSDLPKHAVLVDLSVDPYDFTSNPPQTKGFVGVPEGTLDQYEFAPDDPVYERMDKRIDTTHRRTALSCYSWPGIDPNACMAVYGKQLEPVMRALLEVGVESLDERHGSNNERAVLRAEVSAWQRARPR